MLTLRPSGFAALIVLAAACGSDGSGDDAPAGGANSTAGQDGDSGGREPSSGGSAGASGGRPALGGAGSSSQTGGRTGGSSGGSGRAGSPGRAGAGGSGSDVTAPSSKWVNVTGTLAGMESECGNLTLVASEPGTERVIAGVAKAGLFASDDIGKTWIKLGSGAGSASITNRPSSIVFDPEHPGTFWESGIYNGGGVYRTTDGGKSFEQLGTIAHNDLVSVDLSDPDRQTLLVGGHEQKQTLHLSKDGGKSFENIGANLPAGSHFSSAPLVLGDATFLVGACGWGDGTCGVFASSDDGAHWEQVSDVPAVSRPLVASDGTIYWSTIWNGGLARSTDGGKTFQKVSGSAISAYPVELPDGRIVIVGPERLMASADRGVNWAPIGEPLPFDDAGGVAYSPEHKAFFLWHADCGNAVRADAIMSAGFDYSKE